MIPPTITLKGIWAALIALTFAILIALLAVQTVRLEGFKIWPFSIEGARPKVERMERERDSCVSAGERNARAQADQKLAYEAKYKELADNADDQVERAQSDAMAAADRFIAANRVRRNEGGLSAAPAAPGDSGPPSSDGPGPAPELVAVGEDDIRICTANTIRLEAARDWALSLDALP